MEPLLVLVGECSCRVGEPPLPVALTRIVLVPVPPPPTPPPLPFSVLPALLWMPVCPWPPGELADTPLDGCGALLKVDSDADCECGWWPLPRDREDAWWPFEWCVGDEDCDEGWPMISGLPLPLTPSFDGGVLGLVLRVDELLWLLAGRVKREGKGKRLVKLEVKRNGNRGE